MTLMTSSIGRVADVPATIAGAGRKTLTTLIVSGLIGLALIGLNQPAGAADFNFRDAAHHGDDYGTLMEYAQGIAGADLHLVAIQESSLASAEGASFHGASYRDPDQAALADFAQQIAGARGLEPLSLPLLDRAQAAEPTLVVAQKAAAKSPAPKAVNKAAADATLVGTKVCLTCHASHAAAFEQTLMGRIGKTQKGKFDCENCHGPGSAHAKAGGGRGVGGIISFRPNDTSRTATENNAICLTCHEKGARTYWSGSTHQNRDVACTNCHTVMKQVSRKANLKTTFEPDTCFQCHKDRRAQMARSSHMPIREGKVVCSDCHNPHGSATEALLKTSSINDTCYGCHAEKRGPFLFEHAPVRDNCLNCHDAHGSVNEALLKVSRPRLCAECHGFGHGLTGGPAAVQSMARSCQNCHTQVHGTNSPSGPLLHR
jgi:DmsE family decaheme c-type cytochrome